MANQWKHFLFNDGEALEHGDLNDMWREQERKYLALRLWQSMCLRNGDYGPETVDPHTSTGFVYAGSPLAGCMVGTANNLEVENLAGLIYIPAAATEEPADPLTTDKVHCAYLEKGDITAVLSAGDATNDRIDSIGIRLDTFEETDAENRDYEDASTRALSTQSLDKRRRSTVDFVVVEGTPAASPVPPAMTAGYSRLADIRVEANEAGALLASFGDIWDRRIPGPLYTVDIIGSHMVGLSGTYAPQDDGSMSNPGGASGDEAGAFLGTAPFPAARLIAVSSLHDANTAVRLNSGVMAAGGIIPGGGADVLDISAYMPGSSGSIYESLFDNSGLDRPTWSNGTAHPLGGGLDPLTNMSSLLVEYEAAGADDDIGGCRLVLAGWLGGTF